MRSVMPSRTVSLGTIVKTVGLKGEAKLLPGYDFWAEALEADRLFLVLPKGARKEVTVEKKRTKGNTFILKLSGLESIDDVASYVGSTLEVMLDDLDDDQMPETVRPFQVIGMSVRLADGREIGRVAEMLLGPVQDCLIVENDGERYIIPNVPEVVTGIDREDGSITIDPPDGLLDLRW